jgi:hypothetical protein
LSTLGVLAVARSSLIEHPVAEGEGGGADQREQSDARHFCGLEGFVDQFEGDRSDQQAGA